MRPNLWIILILAMLFPNEGLSQEIFRTMSQPIVNGVVTSNLPSVGLLLVEGGDGIGACSGTLIGCRTVLTAAHCFCGDDTPGSLCQPSPISAVWFQHARPSFISEVVIHPDYLFAVGGDLAIIRLASPVTGIAPAPVNTSSRPPQGSPGLIAGFGRLGGTQLGGGIKRAGLVSTAPCLVANPNTHICWNFESPIGNLGEDSSTCQGDSGGPLFVDLGSGVALGGVTSGGIGDCLAPNNPWQADVFVDRAWIQQTTGADLANTTCGNIPQAGASGAPIQFATGELGPGKSNETWTFDVPPETSQLRVAVNGEGFLGPSFGGNDFDLRVRRGAPPTNSQFDCQAQGTGILEFCELDDPTAGQWFATINRLAGQGKYQLTVTTFEGQSTAGPCIEGPTTLCLANDRFRVEVDWRTPQGTSGKGNAQELTPDTGYFWFFEQSNVEMVIKVLDACSFADRFWVFAGGLTNVEVDIRVTDTVTGETVPYTNPLGTPFQPIQDTNAFATCP